LPVSQLMTITFR